MPTQIIFLYGRPGVGKLTVAEHLAAETGFSLLHNHAVVDLTVTDNFISALQKRVIAGMGTLHFIELRCSNEELEKRITSEPRERFGKLRDVYKYRKLDESGAFDRPKMPAPEFVVDTTNQSPLDSARMIAKHLRQAVLR